MSKAEFVRCIFENKALLKSFLKNRDTCLCCGKNLLRDSFMTAEESKKFDGIDLLFNCTSCLTEYGPFYLLGLHRKSLKEESHG